MSGKEKFHSFHSLRVCYKFRLNTRDALFLNFCHSKDSQKVCKLTSQECGGVKKKWIKYLISHIAHFKHTQRVNFLESLKEWVWTCCLIARTHQTHVSKTLPLKAMFYLVNEFFAMQIFLLSVNLSHHSQALKPIEKHWKALQAENLTRDRLAGKLFLWHASQSEWKVSCTCFARVVRKRVVQWWILPHAWTLLLDNTFTGWVGCVGS